MLPHAEVNDGMGVLETKTQNAFVAKKYEGGINPSHIVQIQQQLLVSERNYGERVCYDNDRSLDVIHQRANEEIQAAIIEKSEEFWNICLQGKEKVAEMQAEPRADLQDKLWLEIYNMAPQGGNEKLVRKFLTEKHKLDQEHEAMINMQGTEEHSMLANKYMQLKGVIKAAEVRIARIANKFIDDMGAEWEMDLPEGGSVTWKPDKNNKRSLKMKVPKADEKEMTKLVMDLL